MDDSQLITTAKADLGWIKKHERILIVLMCLVAGVWVGNRWIDNSASKTSIVAALSAQQLQDMKATNKQQADQTQQATTLYQQTITALTQQNASLSAAVAARNAGLSNQQTKNNTAPLPILAQRWKQLVELQDGDLAASPNGITVSDAGSRATVNQLERVPVLEADLVDTQNVADNRQTELDKANGLIGSINAQVAGLNATVAKEAKDCKAQIDEINANNRKDKRNWFLRGLGIGASIAAYLLK